MTRYEAPGRRFRPLPQKIGAALLVLALPLPLLAGFAPASPAAGLAAPVLKWQRGGCYSSWCETGWYASPAVADLDGDGKPEVIGSAYSVFAVNGEDGALQWRAGTTANRTWPGVVAADLDGDGDVEIVVAQGGGYLTVYSHSGGLVWSRRPTDRELRGLGVLDLDGDGTLEILVTGTAGSKTNSWVYEHDGTLRPGWPQMTGNFGYGWGVFNDNGALGDIDGDSVPEIVVPSDVHYINAYEANGQSIAAHAMYGGKTWGQVGIWESPAIELRGWGACDGVRAESYRANFADGPAVIADVNRDGRAEVIVTGNVYQCGPGSYSSRYTGLYLFNGDRSRFAGAGGVDWTNPPVDTGAPLSEDYSVIESAQPNPVAADLDGDGQKEILFASYDGRLHAFWLDRTEHGSWPYDVAATGPGIRFASEPVVADLDGDGRAEVIFTSWPQKSVGGSGKLHLLTDQGVVLYEIPLPAPVGGAGWNGGLAAPTLADLDGDPDLELVINTSHSGLVAYDLPGTAGARILWGTGRGNFQRTGSLLAGSLRGSTLSTAPPAPGAGQPVTVTIRLTNDGPRLDPVVLTATVPAGTSYGGGLAATAGTAVYTAGQVTWSGAVAAPQPVVIRYRLQIGAGVTGPTPIAHQALVDDGQGAPLALQTLIVANGKTAFLPLVRR